MKASRPFFSVAPKGQKTRLPCAKRLAQGHKFIDRHVKPITVPVLVTNRFNIEIQSIPTFIRSAHRIRGHVDTDRETSYNPAREYTQALGRERGLIHLTDLNSRMFEIRMRAAWKLHCRGVSLVSQMLTLDQYRCIEGVNRRPLELHKEMIQLVLRRRLEFR